MFCKHLQLPKADNLPVAELVENAVPVILGCPGHALVYRHVVVDGAVPTGHSSGQIGLDQSGKGAAGVGAKQEVICLAAARDMVGRMLQACKDAKLELVGMQPEYFCTLKAFEHLQRRNEDAEAPTLYLDIAMGTTKVLIAHGNKLVFAKTVQVGGLDLDKAVAHASDCNLAMAHQKRLEVIARERVPSRNAAVGASIAAQNARNARTAESNGGGVAVAEDRRASGTGRSLGAGIGGEISTQGGEGALIGDVDLSDTLEVLEDEIAMCLRYYEAIFPGRRVAQAVFLGGESLHRGLCQHVARRVRTTALSADPMARVARTGKEPCVNVDFGLAQPGWAVALGLSLLPTDL
jgi:Tfp pilus assembly PilM family ATPase